MILPLLSYISLKSGCRTYLTTHVKRKKKEEGRKHMYTYFHLFVFKQVIAQKKKLNKVKLGSTLLGGPQWSRHFYRVIFRVKAIWLAFDSLIFHDWTFNFFLRKGEKSSNYPFEKILGSGVSYI